MVNNPNPNYSQIYVQQLLIIHVDAHKIFRDGVLHCLKKKMPNIIMEGFSKNAEALKYITDCYSSKKQVDLIITDLKHPGANGLVLAQTIRQLEMNYPVRTPIMMLTMFSDDERILPYVKSGMIDRYYTKDVSPELLVRYLWAAAILTRMHLN